MTEFQDPRHGIVASVDRRRILQAGLAATASAALGTSWSARASSAFPDRVVKIVVPYSAGSGSDLLARTVAQGMGQKPGVSIVVENRDGGGSLIGTQEVVHATPDGYTILMAANPTAILPPQYRQEPYNPSKDLVPITKVAVIPLVLAASPSLPFGDVAGLIAYAKANPGKLSYGSSGPGTISQQQMEIFKQAAGVNIKEIPYKSTAQALTDLIAGTISLFPVVVTSVAPHLKSGRAKGIAIFDVNRSSVVPDVPAVTEQLNVAGYVPTPVWYGFMAPAKTPRDVVEALARLIDAAMDSPDAKARLTTLGAQRLQVDSVRFAADVKSEYDRSVELTRKLGVYR